MRRRSDGTLNLGLLRVTCVLSNADLKDPDAHRGENLLGPVTHRYVPNMHIPGGGMLLPMDGILKICT